MTILATAVWEVRPTNGDNTNGAGYDSGISGAGTDYTNQNGSQLALTDLATAGAAATTVTSATGGFTAAMIGNALRINSGTNFTVGYYFITAHTDTNTITVDRSPTPAGAGSGGNGKVGGATASFNGQTTTTLAASLVAGNKVWVKNEAWNEAVTFSVAGSAGAPITIEGYNTSRGDAPTGANRPTNDRATAAGDAFSHNTGHHHIFKHLRATRAGDAGFGLGGGDNIVFLNVRSYNNAGEGWEVSSTAIDNVWIQCEADTNTSMGIGLGGGSNRVTGCYLHDNTGMGVDSISSGPDCIALFSIIEANANHGIELAGSTTTSVFGCTIDGNTGASSDGINYPGSPNPGTAITNCILSNNGRYGASATDGDSMIADYNNYYQNGTAARNNVPTGANDLALDPQFTDRANGNFAIGANLKAAGYPGAFPQSLSTGYLDIGAVQRQEPAGGGTTIAGTPMRRGMV